MTDVGFPVPIDCVVVGTDAPAAPGDPGSTCSINTSANALSAGSILSGKQGVVQIGQVRIRDSGPNGVYSAGLSDDSVFAVQGIFVP
jgi:hypothetical protein